MIAKQLFPGMEHMEIFVTAMAARVYYDHPELMYLVNLEWNWDMKIFATALEHTTIASSL
jgi:hypothetical protein